MAHGGIYDQLGGGFARYSVDAALARPPLREDALRQRAARPRLPARLAGDWATSAAGGSARRRSTGRCARCAAPRAASTPRSTPTPRARRAASTSGRRTRCARRSARRASAPTRSSACSATGASAPRATSRARNILHVPARRQRPAARRARRRPHARSTPGATERVRPGLDDKRLCSWNALMIAALADAGAALGRDDYLDAARGLRRLRARTRCATPTGRLLRTCKDGEARLNAYLEDHAFLRRGAADALRGDLRGALVRRRARDRRHDDRALRRRRARRLLHDLERPRGADRPPQGRRRPPDPVRQLVRRLRPAAPRRADRRARLRASARVGVLRLFAPAAAAAPRGLRPPAPGARLPPLPRPRGRLVAPANGAAARRASASSPASSARPTARTSCSPAARRAPSAPSCCASAPPSRASPRPTSASTSPARRRSRRDELAALLEVSAGGANSLDTRCACDEFGDRTRRRYLRESAGSARSRTA